MRIHTYYVNCPGHDPHAELRLLGVWRAHWMAHGFEVAVLDDSHARAHPYFAELDAAVAQLPSVNSKAYETACYRRWLAMAQIGGGVMADYDVFVRDAHALERILTEACTAPLNVLQGRNLCPSLVLATADAYLEQCRRFASYRLRPEDQYDGRPHVSDMHILQRRAREEPGSVNFVDAVRNYGSPGFESAPAIHFNNTTMIPLQLVPRWRFIPELLRGCA